MPEAATNFKPSLHGFSFANQFPGYPLFPFLYRIPSLERRALNNSRQIFHGLCGGMCFAAYDLFLVDRLIAREQIPPKPSSSLYRYLYRRQLDTYGAFWRVVFKFMQWTWLSDTQLQHLTQTELVQACDHLHQHRPVVLGLVYTSLSKTLKIWLNHQVLAYGYSQDGERCMINVYDPNWPDRDDIVITATAEPTGFRYDQRSLQTDPQHSIRGIFVIPYTPVNLLAEALQRQRSLPADS